MREHVMPHKYHVAGLGNAIVDIFASVDDQFLLTHKIAKGAMTLIDEFRAFELNKALAEAGDNPEVAGGSVANTMAGLASFGARGVYVGKVHADRLGAVFSASMKNLGVDYTTPLGTKGAATASSLIAVTGDGQRSMNTYLGACRELTPDDVFAADIAGAEITYIEGYLWDEPAAKDASRKAMKIAHESGGKIALTLSDSFCVGRFRDEFLHLFHHELDILFANEDEAHALFQVENFAAVVEKAKAWGGIAALTRSEKGCVIVHGSQVHEVPAAPVSRLLDTTGAGDQFAAGFLYGLTHGKSLPECGKLGGLAAAEVISHYGARPEVPLAELAKTHGLV
jgi:sugar/nucleoside kinase (ribokinase family)